MVSRFEFTLKERQYLKDKSIGAKAEPDWDKFVEDFKNGYKVSGEAKKLIILHPKRQLVADIWKLEWKPVGLSHCNNDLCKIVTMLKTVRNNLFHGGKHGDHEVDDLERGSKEYCSLLAKRFLTSWLYSQILWMIIGEILDEITRALRATAKPPRLMPAIMPHRGRPL